MILKICDLKIKIFGLRNYSIPQKILNGLNLLNSTNPYDSADCGIVFIKGYPPHIQKQVFPTPLTNDKENSISLNDCNYRLNYNIQSHIFTISLKLSDDFILYNLFQSLNAALSILAVLSGGIALHAAGIFSDGRSTIFSGKSGSGKSTLASKLCPPCGLIHDDFILLFKKEPSLYIPYQSPFGKDNTINLSSAHNFPLKEICFNSRGYTNKKTALNKRSSFKKILTNSYISPESEFLSDMILENACNLASEIKGFDFFTVKDSSSEECLALIRNNKYEILYR